MAKKQAISTAPEKVSITASFFAKIEGRKQHFQQGHAYTLTEEGPAMVPSMKKLRRDVLEALPQENISL